VLDQFGHDGPKHDTDSKVGRKYDVSIELQGRNEIVGHRHVEKIDGVRVRPYERECADYPALAIDESKKKMSNPA
jgi:hypothetical protein